MAYNWQFLCRPEVGLMPTRLESGYLLSLPRYVPVATAAWTPGTSSPSQTHIRPFIIHNLITSYEDCVQPSIPTISLSGEFPPPLSISGTLTVNDGSVGQTRR
jgi:hypothetical protein